MKINMHLLLPAVVIIYFIIVILFFNNYCTKINRISDMSELCKMNLDTLLCNYDNNSVDNMPCLVIYFHPECNLCGMEIDELLRYKSKLDNIRLFFISFASIAEIKEYILNFPVGQFHYLTIASDIQGDFVNTFEVKSPPMNFLYDRKGKLVKIHKGIFPYKKLNRCLNKLNCH